MIVLNNIFPVFGLIFLGAVIKKIRLTNDVFLAASDRLIYYAFFPLLLFLKIGSASAMAIDWALCGACTCCRLDSAVGYFSHPSFNRVPIIRGKGVSIDKHFL